MYNATIDDEDDAEKYRCVAVRPSNEMGKDHPRHCRYVCALLLFSVFVSHFPSLLICCRDVACLCVSVGI